MLCEVTVIIVLNLDSEEEGQEAANHILRHAAESHPKMVGYGSNWTYNPKLFSGDHSDAPDMEQTDE